MNVLEAACNYLGWQGGTPHQVRVALTEKQVRLCRMVNAMDEETDMQVAELAEKDIATCEWLLFNLGK